MAVSPASSTLHYPYSVVCEESLIRGLNFKNTTQLKLEFRKFNDCLWSLRRASVMNISNSLNLTK